jgi:hypothetical protein
MSSAGGDASSAAVTEEIVGADVAFRPKSNVVTLVVLVGTWWTWHFARKINGIGLDLAVRQPSTLGYIMGMMYILSWAWLEFSLGFCEYDPYLHAFNYCSPEEFLLLLVGSAIVFCCIMWYVCKSSAHKYSQYAKQQEFEKERASNPYSERKGKVKKHGGCALVLEALLCNVKGPRNSLKHGVCCCLPEVLAEQLLDPSVVSFLILLLIGWSLMSTPEVEPTSVVPVSPAQ